MRTPDFAVTDLSRLADRDLRFIIENFPQPGSSYAEIARVITEFPTTFESILDSDYLYQMICDRTRFLLDVSPFLLFSVLLRRTIPDHRNRLGRRLVNYLANMLSIFARSERLYRIQPYERKTFVYLVEMLEESQRADSRRQFLVHSHIGNYSLFLTGLFPEWIEYRHRYKNRPVDERYYIDFGRTYFHRASTHRMARELQLDEVFLRLSLMFEPYKAALNQLAHRYLFS